MSAIALTYSPQGKGRYATTAQASHQQRDALVINHIAMVRRVALHLADRLDGHIDTDDLIQSGLLGLVEAAERYQKIEGIPFEAYALSRIRGAMLDNLRRNDWCPRDLRKQQRKLKSIQNELLHRLGRQPSERELAEAASLSIEECRHINTSLENASLVSLNTLLEKGESLLPVQRDKTQAAIFGYRMKMTLASALKQLPEREQIIMQLYYYEELNQKEIAQALDLTEARVSQLRNKVVKSLRRKLMESVSECY